MNFNATSIVLTAGVALFARHSSAMALVKVGFASIDISTTKSVPMGGYGVHIGLPSSARLSTGIHDPLQANAIAFEGEFQKGVIIVSLDSVGISRASSLRIREQINNILPETKATVILSATHSHQTPDTMGLWGALPFFTGRNAAYMDMFENNAAAAALKAWERRIPATLSHGIGNYKNTTTKATEKESQNDQISAFVVRDFNGAVLGTLSQWSAHPSTLPEKNTVLSADFVGTYRYFMSQKIPGTHVYVNGAIGNVYPTELTERIPDPFTAGQRSPGMEDYYDKVAAIGSQLANATMAALNSATPLSSELFGSKSTREIFQLENKLFKWASQLNLVEIKPTREGNLETEIALLNLGGIAAVTIPGEIFPNAAYALARKLKNQDPNIHPFYIGIGNDWLGYIMTSADQKNPDFSYNASLSAGKYLLPHIDNAIVELQKRWENPEINFFRFE